MTTEKEFFIEGVLFQLKDSKLTKEASSLAAEKLFLEFSSNLEKEASIKKYLGQKALGAGRVAQTGINKFLNMLKGNIVGGGTIKGRLGSGTSTSGDVYTRLKEVASLGGRTNVASALKGRIKKGKLYTKAGKEVSEIPLSELLSSKQMKKLGINPTASIKRGATGGIYYNPGREEGVLGSIRNLASKKNWQRAVQESTKPAERLLWQRSQDYSKIDPRRYINPRLGERAGPRTRKALGTLQSNLDPMDLGLFVGMPAAQSIASGELPDAENFLIALPAAWGSRFIGRAAGGRGLGQRALTGMGTYIGLEHLLSKNPLVPEKKEDLGLSEEQINRLASAYNVEPEQVIEMLKQSQ